MDDGLPPRDPNTEPYPDNRGTGFYRTMTTTSVFIETLFVFVAIKYFYSIPLMRLFYFDTFLLYFLFYLCSCVYMLFVFTSSESKFVFVSVPFKNIIKFINW